MRSLKFKPIFMTALSLSLLVFGMVLFAIAQNPAPTPPLSPPAQAEPHHPAAAVPPHPPQPGSGAPGGPGPAPQPMINCPCMGMMGMGQGQGQAAPGPMGPRGMGGMRGMSGMMGMAPPMAERAQRAEKMRGEMRERMEERMEEGRHQPRPSRPHMGGHDQPVAERLVANAEKINLSEAQVASLKSSLQSTHKDSIRKRADLEIAQIELQEIGHQDKPDLNQVKAKLQTIANLEADLRLARFKSDTEAMAVLNNEQRAKVKHEMHEKYEKREKMKPEKERKEHKEDKKEKEEKEEKEED